MKHMKQHENKGFTLMEIMVTTAIVAILAAITIPLVARLAQQLKMTEADAVAREIFVAAQNRLSAARASGDLIAFSTDVQTNYSTRDLSVKPGDCPDDMDWQNFYYMTSDDPAIKNDVISDEDVISKTLKGGFIIELNPESGNVYSVFYRAGALDELKKLYEDDSGISLYTYRAREDRSETLTGYYAGAESSATPALRSFAPQVTVVNKEELYLNVTCNGLKSLVATQNNMTITVTLADTHGGKWTKTYTKAELGSDWSFPYDQLSAQVRLDSMEAGRSFAQITEGKLRPGDNITAEVSLLYQNANKIITTVSPVKAAPFNSLFAARKNDGTVEVGYLRQLNNLRSHILSEDNAAGITAVQQTGPIDFDPGKWETDAVCPSAPRTEKSDGTTVIANPLSVFKPLENETLFGSNSARAGQASFAGRELKNFVITGSNDTSDNNPGTGLFSRANCVIRDVRLIDPAVTGGSNMGALVGSLMGGRVENCGVYLATTVDGVYQDQTYMDDSLARHTVSAVSGGQWIGGLVGQALGTSVISESFAAIDARGTVCVGGLVGWFAGGAVSNCYASGSVTAGSYGGGLAGIIHGGSVSQCYATSNVTAGSYGGGFTGYLESGARVSASAAYGLVKRPDTTDLTAMGAFVPAGGARGTVSDCTYLRQNSYNDGFTATVPGVTSATYATLRKAAADNGRSLSSDQSHPYEVKLLGMAFPLAKTGAQTDFYGSWPEEYIIDTSIVYYEVYADASGDETMGYYAEGYTAAASQAWTLNTLKTQSQLTAAGLTVKQDGYAILSVYNLSRMEYTLNGEAMQTITRADTAQSGAFTLLSTERQLTFTDKSSNASFEVAYVYLYQLPFALQETARDKTAAFYDTLKLSCYAKGAGGSGVAVTNNYTFYYCPHFAKNAINPDVNKPQPGRPADPSVIYMRSARQLNALGRVYYYWNTANNGAGNRFAFRQEINISFSDYTKQYCGTVFDLMDTGATNLYRNRPIGESASTSHYGVKPCQFKNSYDGGGYEIKNYCLQSYAADKIRFAGLFGEMLAATLQNIHMVSDGSAYVRSTFVDNDSSAVGGLVGLSYVQGGESCQIYNCSISGYTVRYEAAKAVGNVAVGGLVGINMGEVQNCSAVNKLVKAQITDGTGKVISLGGLVGSNNTTTLSKCYAGGQLTMDVQQNRANTSMGGVSGGYCYTYSGNTGKTASSTMSNCYSFCTFATSSNYTSYGVAGRGPADNSRTYTVTNCYYLAPTVTGTPSAWTGATAVVYTALTKLTITGFAPAQNSFPADTALLGKTYPFPTSVVQTNTAQTPVYVHYGDWPAYTPDPPAGRIGLVSRSKTWVYMMWPLGYWNYSTTAQYGYDASAGQVLTSGAPDIQWAKDTEENRLYLYVSDDLVPAYAPDGTGTDAWTVSSSVPTAIQVSAVKDSSVTASGYSCYALNVGSYSGSKSSYLTFQCRGDTKLTVLVKVSANGKVTITSVP